MPEAADIDWEALNAKMPFERNDEQKAQRKDLFKQFDPNGNGYLSLAEVINQLILFRLTKNNTFIHFNSSLVLNVWVAEEFSKILGVRM